MESLPPKSSDRETRRGLHGQVGETSETEFRSRIDAPGLNFAPAQCKTNRQFRCRKNGDSFSGLLAIGNFLRVYK
jgi:hypothetical protein